MASIADVSRAIQAQVQTIRAAAFPTAVVLFGWPGSAELAAAVRAPLVTVWKRPGYDRNTTRYPDIEYDGPVTPASLTVTTAGTVATFAGPCSPDQIAGVQVGTTAWAIRCTANDTPSTVAASLAALSGGTANGAALTLPGLLAARTARDVPSVTITRQQTSQFAIMVWTSDPDTRDTVGDAIDSALSAVRFLDLADGTQGRLTWAGETYVDRAQQSDLYRRDLVFNVDYSTSIRAARTPVLFPGATFAANNAPAFLHEGALHP